MSASTILLVDDDEVLGQVLQRVLAQQGWTVLQAGTIAEALQKAREQRPDVGLLDLSLPDGDGVDLAAQLEAEVGRFPLLLMTAYPLRLRDHPELARRFRRVLTKPLSLEELRQAVEAALAAPAVETPAPAETHAPAAAPAVQGRAEVPHLEPAAEPSAIPPPEPVPAPKRRWLTLVGGVAVLAAALFLLLPVLGVPGIPNVLAHLKPAAQDQRASPSRHQARLVPGQRDTVELPAEVARVLGVESAVVLAKVAPRMLQLSGSLAFDPNHLGRIQARFAGEVVEIGNNEYPDLAPGGRTEPNRPLKVGDYVKKGQLLAVVWSSSLGEKKSELVDALTQLDLDQKTLKRLEQLYREGNTSEAVVRQARRQVSGDLTAVNRAERTLRIWKLPEEEIKAVYDEAKRIIARKGVRDIQKEKDWARVEVRAPLDGEVVEKNLVVGNMVDPTFDLYKVADLRLMAVYVHAYEEDLRILNDLRAEVSPGLIPWQVRVPANPYAEPLSSPGVERIGSIVDPNQHTALVMGFVENVLRERQPPNGVVVRRVGVLRAGQFVTASIQLPVPGDVVAVPASAVVEDGSDSVVFVQANPKQRRYTMKRVVVARRLGEMVYVRSELEDAQKKRGLAELKAGERLVTEGSLELRAALRELQDKNQDKGQAKNSKAAGT
jgi:cobalt-zinc-cadmium efflux system membrane fusion protein